MTLNTLTHQHINASARPPTPPSTKKSLSTPKSGEDVDNTVDHKVSFGVATDIDDGSHPTKGSGVKFASTPLNKRKTPFPKNFDTRRSTALGPVVIQTVDDVKNIDPTGMQAVRILVTMYDIKQFRTNMVTNGLGSE